MPITKGFQALVDEAMEEVKTYSVESVRARLNDPKVQIVDIRDARELEREGTVVGAFHAPRGMLEFWVDPESPYHKPVFHQPGKRYVLFCAGGWRSALSAQTLQDMGLPDVGHVWRFRGLEGGRRRSGAAARQGCQARVNLRCGGGPDKLIAK